MDVTRRLTWPAPRPVRPAGWWFDGLLLAALVALTVALARGHLLALDSAGAAWADAHRPPAAYWAARVLNFLGQGGWLLLPLAGGLAAALAVRTRSVRPLLVVAGAFLLTSATIGPVKLWTDRAAPRSKLPDKVELFNTLPPTEWDLAYPSGHVANAIVWYAVIVLLLSALLRALGRAPLRPAVATALRVVPPVVVFGTTTYLSFHWITDSVAGLLIGVLLHRLLARVPWDDLPLPPVLARWDRPAGV